VVLAFDGADLSDDSGGFGSISFVNIIFGVDGCFKGSTERKSVIVVAKDLAIPV
jgi:hypothetical protein